MELENIWKQKKQQLNIYWGLKLVQDHVLIDCLTARQHRKDQFVPICGEGNRLSWLRMANEKQYININLSVYITALFSSNANYYYYY